LALCKSFSVSSDGSNACTAALDCTFGCQVIGGLK
jgi:hypothetical protein